MEITRKTLFESAAIQIGMFAARPQSDACGPIDRQDTNAIVLPVSGIFARHDAPGHHVTGTPSHAVLVAADTPYRISFPGAIGDQALILRFDESASKGLIDRGRERTGASHGLLPGRAIMLRNVLWKRLQKAAPDEFKAEALGLDLLAMSFEAMQCDGARPRRGARVRWMRALERVKEAVAAAPAGKWNVMALAKIANSSPFHFCHVFREMTGTSIYDYVLRERLAQTLDALLDEGDITAIALDAGFASHSHFTAHFRKFFGCTPTALRRAARSERLAELRKIVKARPRQLS